ncbi:hypothetical protein [Paenibacillus cineris]|uniref:hypothetical protein n=1 Tax=Paenibacillus cineris TaxID=237530 RepID=UPI001B123283|nr:hypothetical protein [Paenibacillus cineris]GIO63585.1 hypothetical protein J43TS9_51590 [Paenibacillus cineris]
MAQTPMYEAIANSPGTELSADISASDTTIAVLDASKLPDAPNLFTIGVDETAETILYAGKSGNNLTGCTRGFNGTTAKGWSTGAKVARNFTGYDHDTFIANIDELDQRVIAAQTKADAAETPAGAQQKADDAQQAAEDYADQQDALIKADYIRQPGYATTSGTSTAYTVNLNPAPASISDGFGITIVPHVDSGASPTLSINGLTAIALKNMDGTAIQMKTGKPYSFRKVGTDFLASSSGGGVIVKSVQNGAVSLTSTSQNITIGNVDKSKSIVLVNVVYDVNASPQDNLVAAKLVSNTTLNLSRYTSTVTITVYWQVVEFESVKSLQTGDSTFTATTENTVAISPVNMSKSLIICTMKMWTSNTSIQNFSLVYRFKSSTSIGLTGGVSTVTDKVFSWQVVEFN